MTVQALRAAILWLFVLSPPSVALRYGQEDMWGRVHTAWPAVTDLVYHSRCHAVCVLSSHCVAERDKLTPHPDDQQSSRQLPTACNHQARPACILCSCSWRTPRQACTACHTRFATATERVALGICCLAIALKADADACVPPAPAALPSYLTKGYGYPR
jgi:hypothetical protein